MVDLRQLVPKDVFETCFSGEGVFSRRTKGHKQGQWAFSFNNELQSFLDSAYFGFTYKKHDSFHDPYLL